MTGSGTSVPDRVRVASVGPADRAAEDGAYDSAVADGVADGVVGRVSDGVSGEDLSRRERIARWRERTRFDPCVRLDHLFLVDGHSLNVAGVVDRRVVEGPMVLVLSREGGPTADAPPRAGAREPDAGRRRGRLHRTRRSRTAPPRIGLDRPSRHVLALDGGTPRRSTCGDARRGRRHGRNATATSDIPPARDLGLQLGVEVDHLRRVSITAKRLVPSLFPLRVDVIGSRLVVLCRPSPLDAEMATVDAIGPDGTAPVPCTTERRDDHVAVEVDLVALSDALAPRRAGTWTIRAAAPGRRDTPVGRARSDLLNPVDPDREARTTVMLPDRRLTVTVRWTRRAVLTFEVRRRDPAPSRGDETA